MVQGKPNQILSIDFFHGTVDLKKHVFINVREQIRQKMEGISASQF